MRPKFLALMCTALAATACHSDAKPLPVAPEARQESRFLVTPQQLAGRTADDRWVAIHVSRGDSQGYEAAHIPGARFLSLKDVTVAKGDVVNEMPSVEDLATTFTWLGVGDRQRIVLYDDEKGLAAARVFVTLDYLGHGDRTALLDGHLAGWKAENLPLESGMGTWSPLTFTSEPNPNVLVTLTEVQEVSRNTAQVTLVDTRGAQEFHGLKASDLVPRPGHIPGACSVPVAENTREENGVTLFRSIPELDALYPKRERIIVYCRTGNTASQAYFTARMLGRDVRLYDGSYSEWSQQTSTPIATGEAK